MATLLICTSMSHDRAFRDVCAAYLVVPKSSISRCRKRLPRSTTATVSWGVRRLVLVTSHYQTVNGRFLVPG